MSPVSSQDGAWRESFPRVSGDEPTSTGLVAYSTMFSPRERG